MVVSRNRAIIGHVFVIGARAGATVRLRGIEGAVPLLRRCEESDAGVGEDWDDAGGRLERADAIPPGDLFDLS